MPADSPLLLIGAHGRLGRALTPLLDGPWLAPARSELRAEDEIAVAASLSTNKPRAVVNLAAYTNVGSCENEIGWGRACDSNVIAAWAVASNAERAGVPRLHVSSDYALAGPGPHLPDPTWTVGDPTPTTAYGRSKRLGERLALRCGATVVRVAHLCPEDAERYAWVNAYALANREWTEDCAKRMAVFLHWWLRDPSSYAGRVVHLGAPEAATVADMIAARWPGHSGLCHRVTTPEQMIARVGYAAPADTRFAGMWQPPEVSR